MKLILGFSGQIGSGKGTVAKHIVEKYGASHYRFSDILREVSDYLRIEKTRDNLQDLSTILRQRFGQDLLTKIIFEKVREDANDFIVVEGIRLADDVSYLERLPEFKFIYIEANPETRYERILKRKENTGDSEKTFEQFLQDQQDEADIQIQGLKRKAQYTLENNGTIEEFKQKADELIGLIRNK